MTIIKITVHFLIFLFLFSGISKAANAENLLANSGFENTVTGWSSNNSTIGISNLSNTGKYSLLVTNRETNTAGPGQNITQILKNNGKGKYRLQAYLKLKSGTGSGRISVTIYDDTGPNYHSISGSVNADRFSKINGVVNLNWSGSLYYARLHVDTGRETTTTMFIDDIELVSNTNKQSSATTVYYYQSHLSNPQPLVGATIEPRPTAFFISNSDQYSKVNFYCCKGLTGSATGESHDPVITDLNAPFQFSRNTEGMTSGLRELYFDAFPASDDTKSGRVENYAVNFKVGEKVTPNTPNTAPIITGTPSIRVTQNNPYYFQPSVSDLEKDELTFSITGQPSWSIFDNETGRLSGIPVKGETGNYNNIIISVSDGRETTDLPAFNIQVTPITAAKEKPHLQLYYSYNSDLSNAKILEGAVLQGRKTYFFLNKNNQYNRVVFYCCKGHSADATGKPHLPAITDKNAPYSFSIDTSDMATGIRELYIDHFQTDGKVDNHKVFFNLATRSEKPVNTLQISGSPLKRINEESAYHFQPTTKGGNNETLKFTVSGLPHWAGFNSKTGRLAGTPTAGDAGLYNQISISVTDGKTTQYLPTFSIQVDATNSSERSTNETTHTIAYYSYQQDLSNPKPLDGAVLEPRQTYFFINDNGQYKATTFYCCKGLSGNAAGEPHSPSVVDTTSPYRFSFNLAGLASGKRELYFDTFLTTGGVENHAVNFSINTNTIKTDSVQNSNAAQTGNFTVKWTAPTSREDGSPLSLSEITGYKIHYGRSKGNYTNQVQVDSHTATSKTINNIPTGNYYVVITTKDSGGRESAYSKEIVIDVK